MLSLQDALLAFSMLLEDKVRSRPHRILPRLGDFDSSFPFSSMCVFYIYTAEPRFFSWSPPDLHWPTPKSWTHCQRPSLTTPGCACPCLHTALREHLLSPLTVANVLTSGGPLESFRVPNCPSWVADACKGIGGGGSHNPLQQLLTS